MVIFIETHLCLLFHMLQALQKMMALNSISLPEDDTFFNTHIPNSNITLKLYLEQERLQKTHRGRQILHNNVAIYIKILEKRKKENLWGKETAVHAFSTYLRLP